MGSDVSQHQIRIGESNSRCSDSYWLCYSYDYYYDYNGQIGSGCNSYDYYYGYNSQIVVSNGE